MAMPIHRAYDPGSEPIISPSDFYPKLPKFTDVGLVCFSFEARDYVLSHYDCEVFQTVPATANGPLVLYRIKEPNLLFFMSPIGSSTAGAILHEVAYMTEVTKFVYFGSCGVLDASYRGHYLVPTESYREEGYSFHYAPPSDYIEIRGHEYVESFFKKMGLPFLSGRAWTTDGFYNETKAKLAARKNEGVLCVEMESAGLEAISRHIGISYYPFFFAGDLLGETWERGDLGGDKEKARQCGAVEVGIMLAKSLL